MIKYYTRPPLLYEIRIILIDKNINLESYVPIVALIIK